METSKLKEDGNSVRIVGGPSGISFNSEPQVKFVGESAENNVNYIAHAHVRNISFSSYLEECDAEQVKPVENGSTTGTVFYAGGHVDNQNEGDINMPDSVKDVEKQAATFGRRRKGSEISIFEAQTYFSAREGKEIEPNKSRSTRRENSKGAIHTKHKAVSSRDVFCQRIFYPVSSIAAVNSTFRPAVSRGATTSSTSSETSWNSRSGLLSIGRSRPSASLNKSSSNQGKKTTEKCGIPGFGCTCPCSNRKSVETDDTLTETRRSPSVSSSSNSNALVDSPLSSVQYNYPGDGKRLLGRSIEKQISDALEGTINGRNGIKAPIKPVDNPHYGTSKDRELQSKMQRNGAGKYDGDSEEFGEMSREKGKTSSSCEEVAGGFSFPILHQSPINLQEKRSPCLEMFSSPTPQQEKTLNSMAMHERLPSDLHRRLVLFSLDDDRKSFAFNSNSGTRKFGGLSNPNSAADYNDQDKESDSSSDLFEIGGLTTKTTFRRRDSLDDASSIQSGYPFQNSFNFRGGEEPVTPSADSWCYEHSEASLNWRVSTAVTMEKASLGKFSSENSELKMPSAQSSELTERRQSSLNGNSKMRSTGFLGCASEKATSVAAPTGYSHRDQNRYKYEHKVMSNTRRGITQSENMVTAINASSDTCRYRSKDLNAGRRSISTSRT